MTGVSTSANTKMIRNTATAPSHGLTDDATKASGIKENNMGRVFTSKKARSDMVFGKWAKE